MKSSNPIRRSVRRTLFTGFAALTSIGLAAPVIAQEEDLIEEVVVTGSRITNPNLDLASQTLVINEEELNLRQAIDAESLIGELPGIAPGISRSINNGSGGFASLNLRGLGTNRNLVLVDGQRIVPTNLSAVTDLNNIPVALVDRVDIITGGASSVYGADAVAGVANFVMKRDFQGVEFAGTYGRTGESDGRTLRYDLTMGGDLDGGKGNVAVNIGYQEVDGILQGQRPFSQTSFFGTTPLGSGTSVPTAFFGRQYDPATGGLVPDGDESTFNFAPFNYFQTPFERFNVFAKGHYEVADNVEVYSNALYSRNTVNLQLAPSGMFGDTWQVPLSNPFLTQDVRDLMCAEAGIDAATCAAAATATGGSDPNYLEVPTVVNRRLVEQGNRETEYLTNAFQITLGTRGDLTDNIGFDVFGQYGESDRSQTNNNWGLKSLLQQSLRATDAGTCDPAFGPAAGCVPVNLFGTGESISQGTVDFINRPSGTTVKTTLAALVATLNGEFELDFLPADLPVAWVAGYEYRRYEASQNADAAASTQDEVLGTGAPDPLFAGEFDVNEVFGELIVPLVTGRPGIESLTFESGLRISDYSTSGNATTWKTGFSYEPIGGWKVRTMFQEASRSPNIFELFNPPTTGLNNRPFDPCQGRVFVGTPQEADNPALSNPDVVAICTAQGAPAGRVVAGTGGIPRPSAGQINETQGGNTELDVETAESFTFGFVITPDQVPGLAVTVDYYNIEIEDAITAPNPGDIFDPCFGSGSEGDAFANANPNSPGCQFIGRNPLNGSLNGGGDTPGIITQLTNQGFLEASGVDFRVTYDTDVAWGPVDGLFLDLTGNYTMDNKFQASPNSVNRECVGQYSQNCDPSLPEKSFNWRTTASMGDWGNASLLIRWQDGLVFEEGAAPPFGTDATTGAPNNPQFLSMDSETYFDLSYNKTFRDNIDLNFLIVNLTDEEPPITGNFIGATGFNAGNTYPANYDAIGRRYSLTLRYRFE
ncbi:MAG: TonB-dependent receptor [Pseudomonadota bacterium]